ncbi:MAG: DUF2971 domain-containing protein [Lachnospiraceae bacterium]|nr:DUF2971 domain-containing protein [Lachnospiraceae bacterium]
MSWQEEYQKALLDTSANPPDIRKIVDPHIPVKLYKYGSFENPYWKKVIYKAQIYFSPAETFNDPFDCRTNINYQKIIRKGDFRKGLIEKFGKEAIENFSEEMFQKVIEEMRKDVFVFCFSEVWDSILMWAHYANNYNGYCIEYDVKQVKKYMTDNLYPVLYEKEYIDITDNLIKINDNTGIISNLAKAKEWNYEKEWRMVKYNKAPFYFKRPLKSIYLGKNCSVSNKQEIIQWAKTQNKKVYTIEASKTQYKLKSHREI